MRRASIYIELMISMVLVLILLMLSGVAEVWVIRLYKEIKKKMRAELTAENVLYIIEAKQDIPSKMNGFSMSYTTDGSRLYVDIDKFRFEYEVRDLDGF